MKLFLSFISLLFLASCATTPLSDERVPELPKGSEEGDMPWNIPQAGEGAGMMGGMLNQGR